MNIRQFALMLAMMSASSWASEPAPVKEGVEIQTLPEPEIYEEMEIEQQSYEEWARSIWQNLDRQKGEIRIEGAPVLLNVPDQFYFLGAQDAQKVLVDVWNNPPSPGILGLLIPDEYTPFDGDSWAVTIEYEQDGYVSDEDADNLDYDLMLRQMQEDTLNANPDRVAAGYPALELVGWAAAPFYDRETNKLHWAKELAFAEHEQNVLNYNIRMLGRQGVLVMNFIAGIDQLAEVQRSMDSVLALAEFERGAAYSDFDPEIDEVAAYGVGALVAGKVLAKTGFLAIAIAFFKKFGVVIVIALGAMLKGAWGRRKNKLKEASEQS